MSIFTIWPGSNANVRNVHTKRMMNKLLQVVIFALSGLARSMDLWSISRQACKNVISLYYKVPKDMSMRTIFVLVPVTALV